MAVEPRRTEITRDQVAQWLTEFKASKKAKSQRENFIRSKIASLGLKDEGVMTVGHENLPNETSLADMIVADLNSYT